MATKDINGSYPAGYYLNPAYQALNVGAAATVGGAGVTTTASQPSTINNLGKVQGTANGITLSDGGTITNGSSTNSTALIEGTGPVVVNGASATIKNHAVIQSDEAYTGDSVVLNAGGTVMNFATGQITNGISISTAFGTVTNTGTIGGGIGAPSPNDPRLYILNLPPNNYPFEIGYIYGGSQIGYSVQLKAGGSVTNGSSSTSANILNGVQISGAPGTVTNDGTIGGTYYYKGLEARVFIYTGPPGEGFFAYAYSRSVSLSNDGPSISLLNGGTVINGTHGNGAAAISNGIVISGGVGKVTNNGTIGSPDYRAPYAAYSSATGYSIELKAGGSVTNGGTSDTAALITNGIDVSGGTGTIVNYATIHGGIRLEAGGTIINGSAGNATATISGDTGIIASGATTVTNFATIQGTNGTAISFGSASDRLIEEGSGILDGAVSGSGWTLELGGDGGPGTLDGLGSTITGFATVMVDKGATWSLPGTSTLAQVTVINFGTIEGNGGAAIAFASPSNKLIEEGSGVLDGTASGGGGALELGGQGGAGMLSGLGGSITGFATVTVDKGATWSLSGSSAIAQNTVLSNSGTLTLLGQVVNSGQIDNLMGATLAFGGDDSITTDPAVKAGQFTNAGLVEKLSGAGKSIIRTGTASLTDTGTIDVETGILELTGATITISKKIEGAGTIEFGPGATTLAAGTAITAAGLMIAGTGAQVTVAHNLGYVSTFSAGTNTELSIAAGALLQLTGPASFTHDAVDGAGRLTTKGATAVNLVTLRGTAQWYNTGTLTETGALTVGDSASNVATFDNQASGIFDLAGNAGIGIGTGASIFKNEGLLAKTTGSTSAIAIAVANTGTLESESGTLDLQKAVTGNGGILKIDAGEVIQADAVVSSGQTIDFNGGGDRLVLTDAEHFAAKLSNFGAGDKLDLRQFNPTTTTVAFAENGTNTQGALTVTDGSLQAQITLLGQYMASGFHKSSDGAAGGTIVTYTPPAASALATSHS
jgi:fibronectin-binding autotransporter adhesin